MTDDFLWYNFFGRMDIMNFKKIEQEFKSNIFNNEDDIKIHFHSDIIKPILKKFNPEMANQYKSEDILLAGGRTDATFQNITFELKEEFKDNGYIKG